MSQLEHKSTPILTAIHLHELHCRVQRYRPATLDLYRWTLQPFAAWLAGEYGIGSIEQIEARHVQSYLLHKEDGGASGNYLNTIGRNLRAFFNYCVDDELLDRSPMRKIKLPRRPKKILKAIPAGDIAKLLTKARCERDRAMLLFLLDTGVRASECCSVKLGHVDLRAGSADIVAGKGEKDRTVYFGAKTAKALIKYVGGRSNTNEPLFRSERTGEPLTRSGVFQVLRRLGRAAGVKDCSPHAFRRTFAINCLRNGMNIYVVAQLMGHSDIAILRPYLEIVDNDLRASTARHGVVDNL